ncbi:MAG: hypothetical protein O7B99_03820 [Planctomycetota bacterium]|nr:hypothetical protein [Planctomycetota bacterium]
MRIASLALLLALLPGLAQDPAEHASAGICLPDGPVAEAFAAVTPATTAAPLRAVWPAWPDDATWGTDAPWDHWIERVIEEAEATRPDPLRRAELALLAASQGRSADAWTHFAACDASPEIMAALMPRLLPGTPADAPAGRGGLPGQLDDGVLLRPVLPPPTPGLPKGRADVRTVEISGLRVGAAVLRMKLAVEADGVEITLDHLAGGPARVRIVVPAPPELVIRALYLDWQKIDEPGPFVELAIRPGDEEHAIWGRFLPVVTPWPEGLPTEGLGRVFRSGVVVETDPGDPREARLSAFARALGRLFGVPGELRHRGAPSRAPRANEPARLVIGLPADLPAGIAEKKLAAILSLAESLALR